MNIKETMQGGTLLKVSIESELILAVSVPHLVDLVQLSSDIRDSFLAVIYLHTDVAASVSYLHFVILMVGIYVFLVGLKDLGGL